MVVADCEGAPLGSRGELSRKVPHWIFGFFIESLACPYYSKFLLWCCAHCKGFSRPVADSETVSISVPSKEPPTPAVTYTWAQSDATLILVFHVRQASRDGVLVEVAEAIRVHIATDTVDYSFLLQPHAAVVLPAEVSVQRDAVRVALPKAARGMWPILGQLLSEPPAADAPAPVPKATMPLRCVLTARVALTHDTALYTFFVPEPLAAPDRVAGHVRLGLSIDGVVVHRNYTVAAPLLPSLLVPVRRVCVR